MAKHRNKLLIVDGYNITRSGSRYRSLRDVDDFTHDRFNRVREALVNDVIAHMGRDYREGVVVFDAGDNPASAGSEERVGPVRVVFSPAGRSADHVIERLARQARERGVEVMVVTSDADIQDAVFGFGVDRMSAEGFSREAELLDEEARAEHSPQVAPKRTVADRIAPDALAALIALRDGVQ